MRPTLAPGDYLILTKARFLEPGFVVVVEHPKYGMIIKRITSIGLKTIRLAGDSPESTDTADMGDIAFSQIKGRARMAITPEGIKIL